MPEITKKITKLMKALDKLLEDGVKVLAAGKEIKDSLPKKSDKDDKQEA
jgi:hypothetical protein